MKIDGFSQADNETDVPCPYCNGDALEFNSYQADGWIECVQCEAQGPHSHEFQTSRAVAEREALRLWENGKKTKEEELKIFYMVYGDGKGSPRVRHTTEELAQKEAWRLAKLNPGIAFYVLEAILAVRVGRN